MHPYPVPAGDGEHLVHGVDRAKAGRARGSDYCPDPAPGQQRVKRVEVDPARAVCRDLGALDAEHPAHAGVGVMRFLAVGNALARMQFPGDIESLQVRDRAACRQVTEVRAEAEHPGQLRDDLLLHPGGGRSAVQRVVVRVDQHRREVAGHRGRVRRLEHLPGVRRVEERVIVPQSLCELREYAGETLIADGHRLVGFEWAEAILPGGDRVDAAAQPVPQIHLKAGLRSSWPTR